MEPLCIGVLGTARISPLSIVSPARATGHRLVAVAARDTGRAEHFAAEHGVERVLPDYRSLLDDPEVDVVYNPLVNSRHAPLNIAALQQGKHVLTEKPSACNAAEAREVREAALTAERHLVEGFHYLHHPVFARLLELIDGGDLGSIVRTEVCMTMPEPDESDPRWQLSLAGGATMDLGCYALHASRMLGRRLGGEPAVIGAAARERRGHPGVDERLDAEPSPTALPAICLRT